MGNKEMKNSVLMAEKFIIRKLLEGTKDKSEATVPVHPEYYYLNKYSSKGPRNPPSDEVKAWEEKREKVKEYWQSMLKEIEEDFEAHNKEFAVSGDVPHFDSEEEILYFEFEPADWTRKTRKKIKEIFDNYSWNKEYNDEGWEWYYLRSTFSLFPYKVHLDMTKNYNYPIYNPDGIQAWAECGGLKLATITPNSISLSLANFKPSWKGELKRKPHYDVTSRSASKRSLEIEYKSRREKMKSYLGNIDRSDLEDRECPYGLILEIRPEFFDFLQEVKKEIPQNSES